MIEEGKVSEPIRQFLNGLSLMNSPLESMVTEAAESIAMAEKALPVWNKDMSEAKDSDKLQIACLWVHALTGEIVFHLTTLAIQDSILKLERGEFSAAQRQQLKEEIKSTLTEVQRISNNLKAQSPSPAVYG